MTAEELLDQIDELLEDSKYNWASETLSGIRDTVATSGLVTPRQQTAVRNIKNARLRARESEEPLLPSDRLRRSRRYE